MVILFVFSMEVVVQVSVAAACVRVRWGLLSLWLLQVLCHGYATCSFRCVRGRFFIEERRFDERCWFFTTSLVEQNLALMVVSSRGHSACSFRCVLGGLLPCCRCALLVEGSCDHFATRRIEFKLLALKSGRTVFHLCIFVSFFCYVAYYT